MDNVRHLPPNESPEAMLRELTENEKRVTGLLTRGRPLVEIASEMGMSFDEAIELVLGVFMKLDPPSLPEPPTRSPQRPLRSPYLTLRAEDNPSTRRTPAPAAAPSPRPDSLTPHSGSRVRQKRLGLSTSG